MAFASTLKKAAVLFKKAYNKNLLVSNTLTTVTLLGAGDLLTQYIEIKINDPTPSKFSLSQGLFSTAAQTNKMYMTVSMNEKLTVDKKSYGSLVDKIDWSRTAKFAAIGLMMGPFGHFWYTTLDKVYHAHTTMNVVRKVVCDQLVAAPIFNVMTIVGTLVLDGKSLRDSLITLKEKFLGVYLYDCMIWPAAQVVNFNFVPSVHRLLYVNTISLFWNSILSFLMFDQTEAIEEEN